MSHNKRVPEIAHSAGIPIAAPGMGRQAAGIIRSSAGLALARTPGRWQAGVGGIMRVEVSPEAARLVRQLGGRLWVWAARPLFCCWGTPAYMHAAAERPPGLSGFRLVSQAGRDGVEVWFRAPAGRFPDVLEIGLHGRRRPRVEAYWDGCRIAL